ncbi:MAG: hypothetical protein II336_06740 [Loktanella sp.]|nr:hypothetical protein [Loktanella sp.]
MIITLPSMSKRSLQRFFKRKDQPQTPKPDGKPLSPRDIARLFNKQKNPTAASSDKPAKLNDAEKQDRACLSLLRGALYSKD